ESELNKVTLALFPFLTSKNVRLFSLASKEVKAVFRLKSKEVTLFFLIFKDSSATLVLKSMEDKPQLLKFNVVRFANPETFTKFKPEQPIPVMLVNKGLFVKSTLVIPAL